MTFRKRKKKHIFCRFCILLALFYEARITIKSCKQLNFNTKVILNCNWKKKYIYTNERRNCMRKVIHERRILQLYDKLKLKFEKNIVKKYTKYVHKKYPNTMLFLVPKITFFFFFKHNIMFCTIINQLK